MKRGRGRGSAKSRSGCQTCKSRRIKCDEAKPACDACTRSGITCPGYARPLRWSRKHEMHASAPATSSGAVRRYSTPHGEPILGLSRETHPDIFSAPDLSKTGSRMPDWLDLDLNEEDAELAFQDATVLMSQDLTAATPPLMYSNFLGPDPSVTVADTLSQHQSISNSDASDTCDAASIPPLTFIGDPHVSTATGDHDGHEKTGQLADRQEASNRPHALLYTLYRLSSPQSIRRLSDDDFVRYYFNHVSRLHSLFSSDANPFHSLAAKWWSTCPTVSLTIQCMAIAHITNWYPYVAPLGVTKRCQAWQSLQKDLQLQRRGRFDLEKVLLCLFLLGISASWQPGSHLGLQYLHLTRNLLQGKLRGPNSPRETEGLSDFWASALVHWEMLASFVDPVAITPFDGHGLPELHAQVLQGPFVPHPWTGISTELHFILAEVGRISRRQSRCTAFINACTEQEHPHDLDHRWLQKLEELLLTTKISDEAFIEDHRDPATSKQDLIRTAQACRGVGLLEAYRLCPKLLHDRIEENDDSATLPFTLFDEHSGYSRNIDSYLASMAVQTINLIFQVPLSSGASRLQPLLITASASHLRFPDRIDVSMESESSERYDRLVQNRYFVEARVLALSRKLPQAPILKAMDIIKEVWDRLDNAQDGHWIDVMHEKGWQTILG